MRKESRLQLRRLAFENLARIIKIEANTLQIYLSTAFETVVAFTERSWTQRLTNVFNLMCEFNRIST